MSGASGRVAVVGGGLAGITAAVALADAGRDVLLLESRPRLGGLTTSFRRSAPRDRGADGDAGSWSGADLWVDNGQHVFLRCCTAYRALLGRLGTAGDVVLQPRLDVPVLRPGRAPARLRRTGLPAPLHLAASLLRYAPLPWADRLRVGPAALAMKRLDAADPAVDAQSFGQWLAEHGQSPAAVAALWDLVGVATLNLPAAQASLAMAATVFQQGLLGAADAADIGWSRVPLQQLHGDAAARALSAAGAEVRLRTAVRGLELLDDLDDPDAPDDPAGDDSGWLLRTEVNGEPRVEQVAAVVLAVPPAAAERLLPEGALDLPAGWAQRLGTAPIVDVHVRYDRRVLDEPFAAGLDSPVQWVFDRTENHLIESRLIESPLIENRPGAEQYLVVSLSAADDLVDLPAEQVRERILPALAELLPRARGARVLDSFVTRERHATFRAAPGSGALRPPAAAALPGLAVAGAWTDTGWPATMEGAVRSGSAAADALLRQARIPRPSSERDSRHTSPPALRPTGSAA
ncbi:MAG: hydroxysqualene dehydroxylase HpnE [Motilibacteraceae bacterium]